MTLHSHLGQSCPAGFAKLRQLGDPIYVASVWNWDFRDAEMEKRGNKMKRKRQVDKDRHVFLKDRIL